MAKTLDLCLNPYPWYEEMLAMNPVVFSPDYGAYLIFRYDEAKTVLSDYQTFSNTVYDGLPSELVVENSIQGMDPPKHTQLRALAPHAFTPKAIAGYFCFRIKSER